jgi:hypothetical protein
VRSSESRDATSPTLLPWLAIDRWRN